VICNCRRVNDLRPAAQSPIRRPVTTLSTSSRARGARQTSCPPHRDSAARGNPWRSAAQLPPAAGWPPGGTVTRRAPAAFLRPSGPRRRQRVLAPAAEARAARRNVSGDTGDHEGGPSLRRLHYEALQDHGPGRSLRSRRFAIPSGPWTVSLDRDSICAYRRNDPIRRMSTARPVGVAIATSPNAT
jgi:hypothetical protein